MAKAKKIPQKANPQIGVTMAEVFDAAQKVDRASIHDAYHALSSATRETYFDRAPISDLTTPQHFGWIRRAWRTLDGKPDNVEQWTAQAKKALSAAKAGGRTDEVTKLETFIKSLENNERALVKLEMTMKKLWELIRNTKYDGVKYASKKATQICSRVIETSHAVHESGMDGGNVSTIRSEIASLDRVAGSKIVLDRIRTNAASHVGGAHPAPIPEVTSPAKGPASEPEVGGEVKTGEELVEKEGKALAQDGKKLAAGGFLKRNWGKAAIGVGVVAAGGYALSVMNRRNDDANKPKEIA